MELRIQVAGKYLGIPIQTASAEKQELHTLEIFCREDKVMEFRIPAYHEPDSEYHAYISLDPYRGEVLTLRGEFSPFFFKQVIQTDENRQEPVIRPELHFTAERGWINDPNGLVFHEGVYHLFYQYNPMNTEWENMSWGHAVSHDLIHWSHKDTAMYPDEYGTMFSGCGIVNVRGLLGLPEDALLFFYTAAGDTSLWSQGKKAVQRLAYSLDGGKTLVKHPTWQLGHMAGANRDPKIFWHEESKRYVMVLFLDGNEFAVLGSTDLERWETTQMLELPRAWECPDLLELVADDGSKHWVFWSADGFYFLGRFDGREFCPYEGKAGELKEAYGTRLPYAAQTYAGVIGNPVSVAWLRTRHEGHLYTGAMAIPRELSLVKSGDGYRIRFTAVKHLNDVWVPFSKLDMTNGCASFNPSGKPFCLKLSWQEPGNGTLKIGEKVWNINGLAGTISHEDILYTQPEGMPITEMEVIADRGIIEITGNHGIIYLIYETTDYQIEGSVCYEGASAILQAAGMIDY